MNTFNMQNQLNIFIIGGDIANERFEICQSACQQIAVSCVGLQKLLTETKLPNLCLCGRFSANLFDN